MKKAPQRQKMSRDLGILSLERHFGAAEKRRVLADGSPDDGKDLVEFCMNLKGAGLLKHSGLQLGLEPGRLAILKADGKTQHWRRASEDGHEWLSLKFSGEFLRSQLENMRFHLRQDFRGALFREYGASPLLLGRPFKKRTIELIEQLSEQGQVHPMTRLKTRASCLELVADYIFREEGGSEQGTTFCEFYRRQTCAKVERARRIIEKSFREPITLTDLAERVGSSSSHLSRVFSQQTGMTVTEYLRLVRLRNARQQLLSGHLNVTEAALDSGFNHLSYFAKAFQAEFGMKPSSLIRSSGTA